MAARLDKNCHLKKLGNPSYPPLLSSGLNQLRQQSAFCDVTIIVGDQRFPAHKAVLSCASDYFEGMFSSGFQESAMREVTVPGTEDCFTQLLEFAYTGYFTLSVQTAAGILRMANYMMLTDAMKLCAEYLCEVKENLSIDDCFEVWSISCNHSDSLSDVAKLYQEHLVQNFPECGRSDVFLENASADILMEMMDNDDIETDTCTEEQILQVVIAWLKYDWEQRKVSAAHLLKKVRLGLVQVENLKQILGEEILDVPECKDMVEEVFRLNATKDEADVPLIESRPELFASRNTVTGQLFNFAGQEDFFCKTKSGCYKLHHLGDFPYGNPYLKTEYMFGCSAMVYDNKDIYIACGKEDDNDEFHEDTPLDAWLMYESWLEEKNFFKFNLENNVWTVLKPMKRVMRYDSLYLHKWRDYIYAVGDDEEGDCFLQRYSLVSNEWDKCVPVSVPGKYVDNQLHVVVEGHILFAGRNKYYPGNQISYLLYSPMTNAISPVRNKSKNSFFENPNVSYRVDETGICYLMRRMFHGEAIFWQHHRVICDFDNDTPSITIQTKADVEASVRYKAFPKEPQRPFLSFNRRKLRMARKARAYCLCHTGRSKFDFEPALIRNAVLQANAEVDSGVDPVASNTASDTD
ncbi:kelch-like protein 30 [Amphiura filiformis]|uniref:kelch-like protein 30 n=1 Tax=Amphiura filiformis TaxID=82378 RepID=UPI003B20BE58